MKWITDNIHLLIGFLSIWTLGNGILHDVFVLLERKPYERELIRLLIDGHILIFSGLLYAVCLYFLKEYPRPMLVLSLLNAIFMLGYCLLIFKMLPSWGMIGLSVIMIVAVLVTLFSSKINTV